MVIENDCPVCASHKETGLFTLLYATNNLELSGLNYLMPTEKRVRKLGTVQFFVFWAFYEVLIKLNLCMCERWTQFKDS